MDVKEVEMYLRAGTAAGRAETCGVKFQHLTLDSAQCAADTLNARPEAAAGQKALVEPYPCVWCSSSAGSWASWYFWHVGPALTEEERKQYEPE